MARSPFMLAAVAASAVPDLKTAAVVADPVAPVGMDSAVLTSIEGQAFTVRIPRNQAAESRQSAELVALAALTAGARARLPFQVPEVLGQTRVRPTRAVVYSWCAGEPVNLGKIPVEPEGLAWEIGRGIAAIHALPSTTVSDAGLPVGSAARARRWALSLADRVAATGLLPAAVQDRWGDAVEDAQLWQFAPVVIGGELDSASFLAADGHLTSVVGWQGLAVGDPATDLAWVMPNEHIADAVFAGYRSVTADVDRRLQHRAALRSELALGAWLLHGMERRDTEIVDDAVEMLTVLAERVHGDLTARIQPVTAPVLTVTEVSEMLDRQRPAV